MRITKRISIILFALLLSATFALPAYADEMLAFDIDIDNTRWDIIMLNTNEQEYADAHGSTYEDIHSYLAATNTYIDAVHKDSTKEMTVRETPSSGLLENYRFPLGSSLSFDAGVEYGEIMTSAKNCEYRGKYRHPQTTFTVYDITYYYSDSEPDKEFYGRRYVTVINGCKTSVEMFDYDSPLDDSSLEELEKAVASVRFDNVTNTGVIMAAVGVAAGAAVIAATVLLLRRKHRKKAVAADTENQE